MNPAIFAWLNARRMARFQELSCDPDGGGWGRGPWRAGGPFGRHHGPRHGHGPVAPETQGEPGEGHHPHPYRGEPPFGGAHHHGFAAMHDHDGFGGAPFGMRRPLRHLAHKLDLSESQMNELAGILDDLKNDRAQAALDQRTSLSAFATMLSEDDFDEERARAIGEARVKSAERQRDALTQALGRIHRMLDKSQRERFSYLLRTGALML